MFFGFMIGGWEIILLLVALPVALAFLAFWVWMLVDCIRNPRLTACRCRALRDNI